MVQQRYPGPTSRWPPSCFQLASQQKGKKHAKSQPRRSRGFGDAKAQLTFEAPPETTADEADEAGETADDTENDDPEPSQADRIEVPKPRGKVPLDCLGLDGKISNVAPRKQRYSFRNTCGADSAPGEGEKNIMTLTAYHFADCLRACASLNDRGNVVDADKCGAVRFHVDLGFTRTHGGNCWLKKGYDSLVVDKNETTRQYGIFGALVD